MFSDLSFHWETVGPSQVALNMVTEEGRTYLDNILDQPELFETADLGTSRVHYGTVITNEIRYGLVQSYQNLHL